MGPVSGIPGAFRSEWDPSERPPRKDLRSPITNLSVPRLEFGEFPTPVQRLDQLGRAWELPDFHVKRDDLTSSLYGGNKVRKLEFLLAEANNLRKDSVWTLGGIGSHHVLATSIFARRVNLKPKVLHFEQEPTDHVRDVLLALSTRNPQLDLCHSLPELLLRMSLRKISIKSGIDSSTYYIPAGGSRPLGVIGYFEAARELIRQVESGELPGPDIIYVPVGSGGTLAGLGLGLKNSSLNCKLVGIRVMNLLFINTFLVTRLANNTAGLIEQRTSRTLNRISSSDFELLADYVGQGYGETTPEFMNFMDTTAPKVSFRIDPTYTGKTLHALQKERQKRDLGSKTVLYWHTLNQEPLSKWTESSSSDSLPEEYQRFFEGYR